MEYEAPMQVAEFLRLLLAVSDWADAVFPVCVAFAVILIRCAYKMIP